MKKFTSTILAATIALGGMSFTSAFAGSHRFVVAVTSSLVAGVYGTTAGPTGYGRTDKAAIKRIRKICENSYKTKCFVTIRKGSDWRFNARKYCGQLHPRNKRACGL